MESCRKCAGLGLIEPNPITMRFVLIPRICSDCNGTGKKERNIYIGLVVAEDRKT